MTIQTPTDALRLVPECQCNRCAQEAVDADGGSPFDPRLVRMFCCVQCGNKRCPHATDHRLSCTRSNEAGQEGSSYGPPLKSAAPASPLLEGGEDEALIVELKEARKVAAYYADAELYTVIDRDTDLGHDNGDTARAFLARNGKGDLQKMQNNAPRNAPHGLSDEC